MVKNKQNHFKHFLFLLAIFHILVFLKIPHLTWIPGFLGTWFASRGLVYYKDFVQPHFPLSHLFMYPFLKLTNWNLETDPFLALITIILTLIALYYFGRRILSQKAVYAALIFYSIFVWYFATWIQFSQELLLGLFLLPLTFFALNIKEYLNRKSLFLLGLAFALTELTGQLVTLTLLALFLVIITAILKERKLKLLPHFILGAAITTFAAIFYFWKMGALKDFFYWNTSYYFVYSKLSRSLESIPPFGQILAIYAPALALLVLPKRNIPLLLVTASTIPFIIFSIFHPHHILYALPLLAINFGLVTDKLTENRNSHKIIPLLSILTVAFFTLSTVIPWYLQKATRTWVPTVLTEISGDPAQKEVVQWIKENSSKDSKILVAGDPLFYFRSDRLPANSRFSALPWHYLPLSETEKEMAGKFPEFWVVEENYMERLQEGWKTPEVAEFINKKLADCYKVVYNKSGWQAWQKSCKD